MRPFSTCRTRWSTPEAKHAPCPCAAGCRWSASQPAHRPRRRARASTPSELGWARCTTKDLFKMDRQQHQPAATMVLLLDTTSFRNSSAAQGRWPASSRRAAVATQRSARRPHAARWSPRARMHRRHERREDATAAAFAIARDSFLSIYLLWRFHAIFKLKSRFCSFLS